MLKSLLLSQTSKDSSLLFLGTVISTILNIAITVLLTRSLSTGEFGLFITGVTVVLLLTDFFEGGINVSIMNLLPKNEKKSATLIFSSLIIKIVISSVVALILFSGSSYWSVLFFKNESMAEILQISAAGVFLLTLLFWGQNVYQAQKKFLQSSVINTSMNIFRFIALLVLFFLGILTLRSSYWSFQLTLGLIVLTILMGLRRFISWSFFSKKTAEEIIRFGIPIGAGFALAALYSKLDQLLILRIAGDEQAALYGLAMRLTLPISLIATALINAATPRFSSLEDKYFLTYFKKVYTLIMLLSFVSIIGILIAPFVIPIIFGQRYMDAIFVLQILGLGMIFFVLGAPFQAAVLYRFGGNKFYFWNNLCSFVILVSLLFLLIPNYKSLGAAFAFLIMYFFQFVINVMVFKMRRTSK